jgi:hypothetical protein
MSRAATDFPMPPMPRRPTSPTAVESAPSIALIESTRVARRVSLRGSSGAFRCFVAWAAALTKTSAEVIAIDGKTVRRSYQKKGGEEPIHVVSAFAARQRMVLGQIKVGEKSNEIVAIPALLDRRLSVRAQPGSAAQGPGRSARPSELPGLP